MSTLAIIGGTGLCSLPGMEITHQERVNTPYGEPSAEISHALVAGQKVLFLPRHGAGHTIPPHKINYRANLWALQHCGVKQVVAVAAVGGIHASFEPEMLAIPDQIIDYTHSRISTFYEEGLAQVTHIDFSHPYSEPLRQRLITACRQSKIDFCDSGTYGATQGPRLESVAEINRLERDGCTMVGMTGMPEAALARELGLEYATCALSVNWAAGRSAGEISMADIERALVGGMERVRSMLLSLVRDA